MEDCIVVHMPHASLKLPEEFWKAVVIEKEDVIEENIFLADYGIEDFLPMNCENVVATDYSRMFCDVERFKNEEIEPMAKYGQVCYIQRILKEECSSILRVNIEKKYYLIIMINIMHD